MKTFLTLLLFQFFAFSLLAQTKQYKDITISGHFSEKAIGEFIRDTEFWYYKEVPLTDFLTTSNHKFNIENGFFSITIKPESTYGFFRCRATQIPSLNIDYFLIQPGDSIFMEVIDKRNVVFSGRGSEKLNYQHFASKIINNFQRLKPEDSTKYNVSKAELLLTKYKEATSICLDSLEKLNKVSDSKTIEILRLNSIASLLNIYQEILAIEFPFIEEKEKSNTLNQFQLMLLQLQMNPLSDEEVIRASLNYFKLTYSTQLNFWKLKNIGNIYSSAKIHDIYLQFQKNFSSTLRDKLIASLLLNYPEDPDLLSLAQKSLEFISDKEIYNEVDNILIRRNKEIAAFDFTFETSDGKEIKLADFKGRLLIIDTWYKGCSNCAVLAKIIAPLVEKYTKTDKVVFLSVNVDFSKQKFIEGVQSGLYGHTNVVHSWTRGKGANDPFIKHYQYVGYPNILIIDANGKVISTSPYDHEDNVLKNIEDIIKENI